MVNKHFLKNFKRGLTLINSARGGVVQEEDIIDLYQEGFFSNIILDVFKNEPTPSIPYLKTARIFTPHIAGYSYTGKVRGTLMMREALLRHFDIENPTPPSSIPSSTLSLKGLTLSQALNTIFKTTYSITRDASHAQCILENNDGTLFDSLRKNYPQRLEYSNYILTDTEHLDATIFRQLGFQIDS